jgi:feruloyl esterase
VFAGGAIIAGLPYGCATSVQEALESMFQERRVSQRALGERVRTASRHQGPWPKVSVWHGTADKIVKPANAEDVIGQWTHVHALSDLPSYEETVDGHRRRVWNDASGTTLIEAFSISGMGHGVPLSTRNRDAAHGRPGAYFLDVGISSTSHIAESWDLANVAAEAYSTARTPSPVEDGPRTIDLVATADRAVDLDAGHVEPNEDPGQRWPLIPNAVIAAAFKAAGLAAPADTRQPRGSPIVAPNAIIEAALKAAGLLKR